ncbi:MAG: hypothetical protein KAJ49_07735, partial [Arcobacteraceae bacterium]|nr:hypothetical protein [Arcobacteraceae bacterium]
MYKITLNILIIALLTGCGGLTANLKPFVNECCNNTIVTKIVSKRIFIGKFKIIDSNNKNSIFGKQELFILEDSKKEFKDIAINEKLNVLVREEYLKKLKKISKEVFLVDKKPKDFDKNKDIFIDGSISKLWFTNRKTIQPDVINKLTFRKIEIDYENRYLLAITSNINSKKISNELKAIYTNKGTVSNQALNIGMTIMFGGIQNEGIMRTRRLLKVNNMLIADINYYLNSRFTPFTPTIKQSLSAKIYNKNGILIDTINDNNNGEGRKNIPFMYLSRDIGDIITPRVIFYAWDSSYKTKNELKKIKKENIVFKKEYEEC